MKEDPKMPNPTTTGRQDQDEVRPLKLERYSSEYMRKAAIAIHAEVPQAVANEISAIIKQAANDQDSNKAIFANAAREIRDLRRQNELLRGKVDTFDSMMLLLKTNLNHNSQGMCEDIALKMERAVDDMNSGKKPSV